MKTLPAKYLYELRNERVGMALDVPLLSVSIYRGVVPRSEITDAEPRADDLSNYKLCRPNDIIINRMSAFQGAIGISHCHGIVSPEYLVLRPHDHVDARFLNYLMKSAWFVGEMTARIRGIGSADQGNVRTPRINPSDLASIQVSVPPLSLQKTIADYLDREIARINVLIAKKTRLIDLVQDRFESFLFQAISGRLTSFEPATNYRPSGLAWLGSIPSNWDLPPVSANFDVMLGKMLNTDATEGPNQFPYLRNLNVQWGCLDLDEIATMHFDSDDQRRYELQPGDLLVCEGGEVGRSAIWEGQVEPCYFQKAIHRVRPRGQGNTRFLMYCLRAAAGRNLFTVEGNQSTIVHLTAEKLRTYRFPYPSISEQAEIVQILDASSGYTTLLAEKLGDQIQLLAERRQALITAAVTGELKISVPEAVV